MVRNLLTCAAIASAVTVVLVLVVDAPLARAIAPYEPWGGWDAILHVLEYAAGIEPWAYAGATVLAVGTLASLARWPAQAPAWMFVATTHLLARNLMGWIKLFTGRLRPFEWLAKGGGQWLRGGGDFPSGHVVLFASLAIPIAIVAPRLRAPLLAIVAFAMLARVAANWHFASDTTASIALVCACAALWHRIIYARLPASRRR